MNREKLLAFVALIFIIACGFYFFEFIHISSKKPFYENIMEALACYACFYLVLQCNIEIKKLNQNK